MREYACSAGREVVSYLVKDNGHAWPGGERGSRLGDAPNPSVPATEIMWRFFAAHGKN